MQGYYKILLWSEMEKEMATYSSILAWRIPWTEEPGGLQSMGSQTVGHDWVTNTWKKKSILCFFSFIALTRRRQWQLIPVLLPGKSHGRRSPVGCSPWGHEESDTTERLHFHLSLSCIGEGNGNPLQCSCLENPRDGGAWWAAIYGVAQSRTRLKWLSSSSSTSQNLYLPIYLIVYCLCNTIPILWGKIYVHRKGKNQKKYRVMICFTFFLEIFFPKWVNFYYKMEVTLKIAFSKTIWWSLAL